jgi:GNAT superfamily N-acetyltransferase
VITAVRVEGTAAEAQELLRAMEEGVRRWYGPVEPERTSVVAPAELVPPSGIYVVLREGGAAVAGGGVRALDEPGVGEVKRMFVRPAARGRGLGRRLLGELEAAAADLGHRVLRLDTAGRLRGFYEAAGYRSIPDYNGNSYATFWGEKTLS